jgi:hypothetical protein
MSSIQETGHAKNVANFQEIISFCESYGTTYNPSKESLKLESLKNLYEEARKQLDTVIKKVTNFNNVVTTRQNTFANIKPLFTKVVNAFTVTDASDQSIKDIKSLNKKIQGTAPKKKSIIMPSIDDVSTPDAKTISTSQQSYDSVTEHHAKVISLLSAEPSYKPNEEELQIKSLIELLNKMKDSTKNVTTSFAEVSNARIMRNEILYKTNTSLYNVAMDVKNYVKSIFSATSPQYKQISKIKFSKGK